MPQTAITNLIINGVKPPTIDLTIDMTGLSNRLMAMMGDSKQPNDLYEVFNTATDPAGQPYFWAVNDGTSSKVARRAKNMRFWAGGHVLSIKRTGPNKAYHMRERAIPLIRKFFALAVQEAQGIHTTSGGTRYGDTTATMTPILRTPAGSYRNLQGLRIPSGSMINGIFEPAINLYGKQMYHTEWSTVGPRYDKSYWISVMEDVMDYSIYLLAEFTPIIKEEYQSSEGYTPAPGLLKGSYHWTRITDDNGQPEMLTNIEKDWLSRNPIVVEKGLSSKISGFIKTTIRSLNKRYSGMRARYGKEKVSYKAKTLHITGPTLLRRSLRGGSNKRVIGTSENRVTISKNRNLSRIIGHLQQHVNIFGGIKHIGKK